LSREVDRPNEPSTNICKKMPSTPAFKYNWCFVCCKQGVHGERRSNPDPTIATAVAQNMRFIKDLKQTNNLVQAVLCNSCRMAYVHSRNKSLAQKLKSFPIQLSHQNIETTDAPKRTKAVITQHTYSIASSSSTIVPLQNITTYVQPSSATMPQSISNFLEQFFKNKGLQTQTSTTLATLKQGKQYTLDVRNTIAELAAAGIAFEKIGKTIKIVLKSEEAGGKLVTDAIHKNTAQRILVEYALAIEYCIALMASVSTELFVSIDGMQHADRKFSSLEIGGVYNNEMWVLPLQLSQVTTSTAQQQAEHIELCINYISDLQQELDVSRINLLNICTIAYDNCNTNTGRKNGIYAHLNEKRKQLHLRSNSQDPYVPLIDKGCSEHILSLCCKHFHSNLLQFLTEQKLFHLTRDSSHSVLWLVHHLSSKLRNEWKPYFVAFLTANNLPHVQIRRTLDTRYLTNEVMALIIMRYYFVIILLIRTLHFPEKSTVAAQDSIAFKMLLNLDVIAILTTMAAMAEKVYLPLRIAFYKVSTINEYNQLMLSTFQNLSSTMESIDKRLQFFRIETVTSKEFEHLWRLHFDSQLKSDEEVSAIEYAKSVTYLAITKNSSIEIEKSLNDMLQQNLTQYSKFVEMFPSCTPSFEPMLVPQSHATIQETNAATTTTITPIIPSEQLESMHTQATNENTTTQALSPTQRFAEYQELIVTALVSGFKKFDSDLELISKEHGHYRIKTTTRTNESHGGELKYFIDRQNRTSAVVIDARIKTKAWQSAFLNSSVLLHYVFQNFDLITKARKRIDSKQTLTDFAYLVYKTQILHITSMRIHAIHTYNEQENAKPILLLLKTLGRIHEEDTNVTVVQLRELLKAIKNLKVIPKELLYYSKKSKEELLTTVLNLLGDENFAQIIDRNRHNLVVNKDKQESQLTQNCTESQASQDSRMLESNSNCFTVKRTRVQDELIECENDAKKARVMFTYNDTWSSAFSFTSESSSELTDNDNA